MVIVVAIVVLFGPDKIPEIARGLGEGIRKMRGAMEDVKSEILKETDNPLSEIKREIEKVKQAAQDYDPTSQLKKGLDFSTNPVEKSSENLAENSTPIVDKLSEDHSGPVSR